MENKIFKNSIIIAFLLMIVISLSYISSAGYSTLWNPYTNRLDFVRNSNLTDEKVYLAETNVRDNLTVQGTLIVKNSFSTMGMGNTTFLSNVSVNTLHSLNYTDVVASTFKVYSINGTNEVLLNSANYSMDFSYGNFMLTSTRWQTGYNITLDWDRYYMPVNLTAGDAYVDGNLSINKDILVAKNIYSLNNIGTYISLAVNNAISFFTGNIEMLKLNLTDTIISNNVTINGKIDLRDYLDLFSVTTPLAPQANELRLYAQTTQGHTRPVVVDDDGEEFVLNRDNVFVGRNTGGVPILRGQAVYVCGATGNVPNVCLASNNDTTKMPAVGMAHENITTNAFGNIILLGLITSFDTSSFSVGDRIFVNVSGGLTSTRPIYPNSVQRMGSIIVSGVGNGVIYVTTAPFLGMEESGTTNKNYTFGGNVTINDRLDVINNLSTNWIRGGMNWTNLDLYPVACPAGYFVTQIADTTTCTAANTSIGNLDLGGYNLTNGNYGFFSYLGSDLTRILKGWFDTVDMGTANVTNLTVDNYKLNNTVLLNLRNQTIGLDYTGFYDKTNNTVALYIATNNSNASYTTNLWDALDTPVSITDVGILNTLAVGNISATGNITTTQNFNGKNITINGNLVLSYNSTCTFIFSPASTGKIEVCN